MIYSSTSVSWSATSIAADGQQYVNSTSSDNMLPPGVEMFL